jgi:hypothetical protein
MSVHHLQLDDEQFNAVIAGLRLFQALTDDPPTCTMLDERGVPDAEANLAIMTIAEESGDILLGDALEEFLLELT